MKVNTILKVRDLDIQISDQYPINLEFCIKDIRNLDQIQGSRSHSLVINGSDEVNKLFSHLFNINSDSFDFNTRVKQECEIVKGNDRLLKGYFQIININYISKNNIEYDIIVFDEQVNLFIDIEEKLITGNFDPEDDIDFSQWDHIYNRDNIIESWDLDHKDLPYFYPLFDTNNNSWINASDHKPAFYVRSLWDHIFNKYGYTYTSNFIQNNKFNFNDLVIPFQTNDDLPKIDQDEIDRRMVETRTLCQSRIGSPNSGGLNFGDATIFLGEDFRFEEIVDGLGNTVQANPPTKVQNFLYLNDYQGGTSDLFIASTGSCPSDPGGDFPYSNMGKFVVDRGGLYKIELDIPVRFRLYNSFPTNFTAISDTELSFEVNIVKNGIGTIKSVIATPRDPSANYNNFPNWPDIPWNADPSTVNDFYINLQAVVEDLELGINDEITVKIKCLNGGVYDLSFPFRTKGHIEFFNWQSDKTRNNFIKLQGQESYIGENSEIKLNDFLPKEFKQKDFIKSINNMFNLYWMPDPENDKNIIIETKDEFYENPDIYDLNANDNNYFLIDRPTSYKVISELMDKEILFKYDDDAENSEDIGKNLLKIYKDDNKKEYGQQRVIFENENLNGKKVIDLNFASTVVKKSEGGLGYITSGINSREPKNKLRILYKNILPVNRNYTNKDFYFKKREFGVADNNLDLNEYATATHFDDPIFPIYDINYGTNDYYFYSYKQLTESNLFNNFWINTVRDIDSEKMYICKVYMSNHFVKNLKMNSLFYFEQNGFRNYYVINKIREYNTKTGEAVLELITFNKRKFEIIEDTKGLGDLTGITDLRPDFGTIGRPTIDWGVIGRRPLAPYTFNIGDNFVNTRNISIGNFNFIDGQRNLVLGDSNVVNLNNNMVLGNNNLVNSNNVLVIGNNNTTTESGLVVGNNIIQGSASITTDSIETGDITINNTLIIGPSASIIGLTGFGGGTQSLADTLAVGNITGGNDIIISNGDSIEFENVGGVNQVNSRFSILARDSTNDKVRQIRSEYLGWRTVQHTLDKTALENLSSSTSNISTISLADLGVDTNDIVLVDKVLVEVNASNWAGGSVFLWQYAGDLPLQGFAYFNVKDSATGYTGTRYYECGVYTDGSIRNVRLFTGSSSSRRLRVRATNDTAITGIGVSDTMVFTIFYKVIEQGFMES